MDELTERRLSSDGRRIVVVTRWLDRQVSPPRWRSKNQTIKLRPNEVEYFRQRPFGALTGHSRDAQGTETA